MNSKYLNRTFFFSSASLILIFSASASPIPTYVRLQQRLDLSTGLISLTAVCYFVGCILSLLLFARLSDHVGRKRMAIITVLLGLVGLGLLATLTNGTILLIARFIQGVCCGLGSSTLSVLIIESGEGLPGSLVSAIAGSAVLLGLALGGFLSGTIAQFLPDQTNLTYVILIIALLIMLFGLIGSRETIETKPGALKSLNPRIKLPASIKTQLVPALGCFIATWAIGGYFQAFSATISKTVFNLNSPFVAAIILVSYMAPNMVGSHLSDRFSTASGQLLGITGFMITMLLMAASIQLRSFPFYLGAVIAASVMQGIAYTASMNGLLRRVLKTENTCIISIIYIASYAGAGIPSLIASRLSSSLNFFQITGLYVLFVCVICVIVIYHLLLKSRTNRD